VTFGELLASGERPLVWSLDEQLRMVARPMTNVFPSGRKEVFRLRLASGREVEATGNHPFMTIDGWTPLEDLKIGDRIATPRRVPEPVDTQRMADSDVILLAHMIGDGSCLRNQPIRYASIDEANLAAVTISAAHFGVTAVRDDYPAARVTTLRLPAPYHLTHGKRNPIAAWLDRLGLFGLRSHEKFVPRQVFSLPNDQVALFVRHLWATDGSVRWESVADQGKIYYASTSRGLVDGIAQLLLRLGIHTRVARVCKSGYRDCWHVSVDRTEYQVRFLRNIGVYGARGQFAQEVLAKLDARVSRPGAETIPKEVWAKIQEALTAKGMTHRELSAAMNSHFADATRRFAPGRSRLHRAAAFLDDRELHALAISDVFWDKIVEITSIGERDVFDGTVSGTHNFVANGINLHNSLEQDSDVVLLLHRPDMFEHEDSERLGEADLIIGKHRNGPTKTVTVAHQLHFSRFTNMARS